MAESHMARVVIINRTNNALNNIVLVHQFGDYPAQTFTWDGSLETPKQSSSVNVGFSTGFGSSTDWDWWSLSWETTDGNGQRYAHSLCPSVLNIISDYFLMQGSGIKAASSSAGHAVSVATPSIPSIVVSSGVSAANELVNFALGGIMRSVSKKELINFTLHDYDAYVVGSTSPEIAFIVESDSQDSKVTIVTSAGNNKGRKKEFPCSKMAIPPEIGEM